MAIRVFGARRFMPIASSRARIRVSFPSKPSRVQAESSLFLSSDIPTILFITSSPILTTAGGGSRQADHRLIADMRSEMLGSRGGRRLRVVKSRYRDLRIVRSEGARMFRPSPTNVTVGSEDVAIGSHQPAGAPRKVWRSCGGSRPRQVPEFACLWRCGAWFAIGGPCRLELLTGISTL
jgi:hypothetical protein